MKINLLTLGFIVSVVLFVLDVAGAVELTWWMILLPTLIPFALLIGGILFAMFVAMCIVYDYQKNPHKYVRTVKKDGTVTYRRV